MRDESDLLNVDFLWKITSALYEGYLYVGRGGVISIVLNKIGNFEILTKNKKVRRRKTNLGMSSLEFF